MKQLIKETSIYNKRKKGFSKVITYGYDTNAQGLSVVRTINKNIKEFTPVQTCTGVSLGLCFSSYIKAIKFVNKYLSSFNFNVPTKKIASNLKIKQIIIHHKYAIYE